MEHFSSKGSIWAQHVEGYSAVCIYFRAGLAFVVGNGSRVKFWEDIWCGERPLRQDFPDVYELAVEPTSLVAANFSAHSREII